MDAITPTHLYVGPRAAVIAETGVSGCASGKYLLIPVGRVDFVQDGCATRKELMEYVDAWKREVPGIKIVYL